MSRLLLAIPLALFLLAAPAFAQSAQDHAASARKAQKSNNWKKALEEWQAAYKAQPDADYLVGMGDAYAKLGDKANAKKQYEAYLADPLALDTGSVKNKLAALDKPSGDDLGLDLAAAAPAAKPAAGGDDLGLDLSAAPAKDTKKKKGHTAAVAAGAAGADLGLDLAAPPPSAKPAAGGDLGLDLPPPAPVAAKAPPPKPASGDLDLDLSPPPKKAAVAVAATTPPPAPSKAAASSTPPPAPAPAKVAVATQTKPPPPASANPPAATKPAAPAGAVTASKTEDNSGKTRVVAYVSAGAAVVALAVGGLYFSKASQDQNQLEDGYHSSAEASQLLEQQKTHKSLAFAGLATGLVLAGVATALFTF